MSPSLLERANAGLHDSLLEKISSLSSHQARILDVGCGSGAWLERLKRAGFADLTGLDLDTEQSAAAGTPIFKADLNQPDWAGLAGPYDVITSIEVIEHIENLGVYLDKLSQLVAPDGYILLTTPNVESLASRLRFLLLNQLKQFDSIGDQTHIFPVLSYTLPRMLSRRNLVETQRWGFPNDGSTRTSRGAVNLVCSLLRAFLPEPNKGDNLCLILRKGAATR